jgi:hypothetical protein
MKVIKKRTILLIVLCIMLGFFTAYRVFVAPKKSTQAWIVPNEQNISKKFITKETLVNEIHQKKELITMETQMSEKISLDDSWGTLSIFKKVQNINYYATGTYVVNLSSLKAENIEIDNNSKRVIVRVPLPSIKDVNIDEEKTEYQTPENGILRFGEIKLTSEETQIMRKSIKDKMLNKMNQQDLISQASKASEDTLKVLVQTILQNKTNDKYDINIEYIK